MHLSAIFYHTSQLTKIYHQGRWLDSSSALAIVLNILYMISVELETGYVFYRSLSPYSNLLLNNMK